jgi:hypothetical protein
MLKDLEQRYNVLSYLITSLDMLFIIVKLQNFDYRLGNNEKGLMAYWFKRPLTKVYSE